MFGVKVWSLIVILSVFNAASALRYFPDDSVWFEDVSNAALDSESQQIIDWLVENSGWGKNLFRMDLFQINSESLTDF